MYTCCNEIFSSGLPTGLETIERRLVQFIHKIIYINSLKVAVKILKRNY